MHLENDCVRIHVLPSSKECLTIKINLNKHRLACFIQIRKKNSIELREGDRHFLPVLLCLQRKYREKGLEKGLPQSKSEMVVKFIVNWS